MASPTKMLDLLPKQAIQMIDRTLLYASFRGRPPRTGLQLPVGGVLRNKIPRLTSEFGTTVQLSAFSLLQLYISSDRSASSAYGRRDPLSSRTPCQA